MCSPNPPNLRLQKGRVCNSASSSLLRGSIDARILFWVLVFLALASRTADHLVLWLWTICSSSAFFRHDSFEPLLATFSFSLWINVWHAVDEVARYSPTVFQKYKIVLKSKHDRPPPVPVNDTFMYFYKFSAIVAYLAPLLLIDLLYPRRAAKLDRPAPTALNLVGELLLGFLLYDFIFFPVHLAMHKVPCLRWMHTKHHYKGPHLTGGEVVRHSFLDGMLQVAANVLTLNCLGSHPLTRAFHNITITYMLTELHCGYDMPFMLHNLVPYHILGGPRAHHEHHTDGSKHYQQFFTYLDYMYARLSI